MKTKWKKVFMILGLVILLIIDNYEITVEASSAEDNVKGKITAYVNTLGGSFNKNYKNKASGCCAFCNYVWNNVFATDMYSGTCTKYDGSGNLISFLQQYNARPGDIIWGKGGHNMILMGYDSNGIYVTDGTSSGKVWHNNSYISFNSLDYKNYYKGYFSKGFRLYHLNDSIYSKFAPSDTTPPVISDVQITDHDNNGYTISCVVTDNSGNIAKVQFPTWTEYNGQDDLAANWGDNPSVRGTWNGNRVYFRVNVSDHNYEEGIYTTHIYAYDHSGNHISVGASVMIDRTEPVISNVRIEDVSVSGYTVYCDVTDNTGIERVQFPTWTEYNGQDDLDGDWWSGTKSRGTWIGGNTFAFRVNRSEHNDEIEGYATDIYAWDNYGNRTVTGVRVSCLLGNKIDFGSDFVASIQNTYSNTVLTNDNTNVSGRAYRGNLNQKWLFKREDNGNYRIYSLSDIGKCLSVAATLDQSGINVGAYAANGASGQSWKIYGTVGQGYYFVPEFSAVQALDLDGGSAKEGTNVQIYRSSADYPQNFSINYLITSIGLSDTELNMKSGTSQMLTAQIWPAAATNKNIIWSTSDSSVATVANGTIVAKSAGTAIITATTEDSAWGGSPIAAQCKVTVFDDGSNENIDEQPSNDGQDRDVTEDSSQENQEYNDDLDHDMDWDEDKNQDKIVDKKPNKGMIVEIKNHQYIVTSSSMPNPAVAYNGCQGDVRSIVVPNTVTIGGITYKVTGIAEGAFSNSKKLKHVTIGKNVETIEASAFANCPNLEKVTINSKKLKKIGANAFKNDRKLKTIIVKSSKLTSKSIGKNAIAGSNARLKIKVPKKKVKVYQNWFKKRGNAKVKVMKL